MRLRITAALIVLFAFSICCSGAAISALWMAESHGCCESECARASSERSCEFIAPEKREHERPMAAAAMLPAAAAPHAPVALLATSAAAASRLFDPLTTIQLRI